MNPKTVLGQTIATAGFLVMLAIGGRPLLAAALALAGGTWVLALNAAYARRLKDRRRTARRIEGDRAIAKQQLVSYAGPLAIAIVLAATGATVELDLGPMKAHEVQGLLGVVAVTLVAWLASSHVDWYWIRPRVDGVIGPPPCMTSRDTRWKGVTRKWYIHRAAASVVTMGAVVAIALIATMVLAREWPNALAQIGGFAAIFAVGIWLMHDEIRSAASISRSIRSPHYWVGDDLRYETDMWRRRGFVLHVAVPVTKLVPLRATGELKDSSYVEVPTTLFMDAHLEPQAFTGCKHDGFPCERINPECTWRVDKTDDGRRRLLVL